MHRRVLSSVAAAVLAACALPASALNIVLHDPTNSFGTSANGADALYAFQKAANYWNKTISTDVTVNIKIGFAALASGVLGQAGSNSQYVSVADVYGALASTGNSALDTIAVANLSPLNAQGGIQMRLNNYYDTANKVGLNYDATRLTSGNGDISKYLDVNQSVIKALGLQGKALSSASNYDASITFSSNFGFDFNPTNGITTGQYDFTAVAIHELGHALGFVSGTDTLDILSHGRGPASIVNNFETGVYGSTNIEDWAIGSTLDLFRYGNGIDASGQYYLQWSANRTAFFSIDRKHVFSYPEDQQELAFFSTGRYAGDGQQASHWKDNLAALDADTFGACFQSARSIGVMDPTAASCDGGVVSQNDLAAFDAMGWNTTVDVLANKGYAVNTAQAFAMDGLAAAVPEPGTWAQMLLGVAAVGGFLARRRGVSTRA